MTRKSEKAAIKELGTWTIDSAKESLLEFGYRGSPSARNGRLLFQRSQIDENISNNIIEEFVLNKRLSFLNSRPEEMSAIQMVEFRTKYILEYLTEDKHGIWDEAKNISKIKDSINEESFISFLVEKYGEKKFKEIAEVKKAVDKLNANHQL